MRKQLGALSVIIFLLAVSDASSASATPVGASIAGQDAEYIVRLKTAAALDDALTTAAIHGTSIGPVWHHALTGFLATLSPDEVSDLRSDPNVMSVEPNFVFTVATEQDDPSWGLDRIDQQALPLSGSYNFDTTGSGVVAYVVDSGIRTTHTEFSGRIPRSWYWNFNDGTGVEDCDGHGTHVAGIIGGTTYGVAKQVSLVPVKVLNCAGSGSAASIIAGFDFIVADHPAGVPAVANISITGPPSTSVDAAVNSAIADGVTVVAAAGNEGLQSCSYTPARVPGAITVGASDMFDAVATYSNYGACNDLFAPGSAILSAWIGTDNATNTINGTSMASPHVAGAVARILQSTPAEAPAQVWAEINEQATTGVLAGTHANPNKLLFVAPQLTPAVPGRPSGLTGVSGDSQVGLSWSPATAHGSPITDYVVQFRTAGGQWSTFPDGSSTASTTTVTGLSNGVPYDFQVAAVNGVGMGLYSTSISVTPAVAATPDVTWAEPEAGSTVSGDVVLKAIAQPGLVSSKVTKWCLRRDGVAVTTDISAIATGYSDVYFYGVFSGATGCWTSTLSMVNGAFEFDTRTWANGGHSFHVTVTDSSGQSSVTAVLTLNVQNLPPDVTWVSPAQGSTVAGVVVLEATAQADSSDTDLTSWCLRIDGVPVTEDVSVYESGYSDVYVWGLFSGATGCWTSSFGMDSGAFEFDTTALANGDHSFELIVTDSFNRSAGSTLGVTVANALPGFSGITPVRLFDTRPDAPQGVVWVDKSRRVGPMNTLRIPVAGVAGLPSSGVAAVSLNVTVVNTQGAGFVTVYPCGELPLASNLNYVVNQVVPNAVIAPVSANGEVCFYASVNTDLFADANGWFISGTGFSAVSPLRLFDSRPLESQGAVWIAKQRYGGSNVLRARVTGIGNVPASGVGAVSLNVTVTDSDIPGFVTVYPCGSLPLASSLNFVARQVVPNAVIAPVSTDGEICLYSNTAVHLLADVNGWFAEGAGFTASSPARLFDTRLDAPQGAVWVNKTLWVGPGRTLRIDVIGEAGMPWSGMSAVSLNVTVVNPQGAGYVTVYPCGSLPLASNLNFVADQIVPNAVLAPVSASGEVCFYSSVNTDLLADVNGWFT